MSNRSLEIKRKLFHLFFGVALVFLIYYDFLNIYSLGAFSIIAFLFFWLSKKIHIPPAEWILEKLERPGVRKSFPGKGSLFYLLGCEFSLLFFEKEVALACILILAFGDSIPNFVGMDFRKIRHPFSRKKFLEGTFAGIFISFLAASIFVSWYEALIASTVALIVEGIDLRIGLEKLDDNLVVPLSAGAVIWLMRIFGL